MEKNAAISGFTRTARTLSIWRFSDTRVCPASLTSSRAEMSTVNPRYRSLATTSSPARTAGHGSSARAAGAGA